MRYSITPSVTALGKVIVKPGKSFSFLAYLIQGEKNVLIDTVPERSAEAFLEDLGACLPLEALDALILNHAEEDHSGALGALLARRPDLPVYCTAATRKRLVEKYPAARFCPVESGSTLSIGARRFRFTHTPGLHWDDNMTTFYENEGILFSNDLFGQSLGAEVPLDTEFSREALLAGAKAYFDQVFTPATAEERSVVPGLCRPAPACVAPGHGVVLRGGLSTVLDYYLEVCGGAAVKS